MTFLVMVSLVAWGQQTNLPCNAFTPWVNPNFVSLAVSVDDSGAACWNPHPVTGCLVGSGSNPPSNVINSNLTDFALGRITALGSLTLRVTDNTNTYSAGNFAGFAISNSILGVNTTITIRTYNDNGLRNTFVQGSLIGLNLGSGPFLTGGITTEAFDAIEIEISATLSLGDFEVYYAVMEKFCAPLPADTLKCNIPTAMNKPAHPMTIDYANTGASGITIGTVSNPEDAISNSTSDFAALNNLVSVLGSMSIAIQDQVTDYPAGTFVGFDIENTNPLLLGLNLLSSLAVVSYLNGVPQDTVSGANLLLNVPLLSGGERQTVGFVSATAVDKVKLIINTNGLPLSTTKVYSAIFQKFCSGPALGCNTPAGITAPPHPLYIEMARTGHFSGACVDCSINNPGNLIDTVSGNAASIVIVAGASGSSAISVRNALDTFPANSFAGFRIQRTGILDINLLNGITIKTFLNGVPRDTASGLSQLLAIDSDLLLSESSEQVVGFLTDLTYNEVQLSFNNTLAVTLGTTLVKDFIVSAFCAADVECETTYNWSNPNFPVYVNFQRTGKTGAVCGNVSLVNTQDVLSADPEDYATIEFLADVECVASISVHDALFTYPPGTHVGFLLEDVSGLIELGLFDGITITTYNNGAVADSIEAGDLLDLSLIILYVSPSEGIFPIGFEATQPFDEVRISVGSLVGVLNEIRVHSAFVNTNKSNGGMGSGLDCFAGPEAEDDEIEIDEDTTVSISALGNDFKGDGTLVLFQVPGAPQHGVVQPYNPADSTFTYIPDPNFVGVDSFTYRICDNSAPQLCSEAKVRITVNPVTDTLNYVIPPDEPYEICAGSLTVFGAGAQTSISQCTGNNPSGEIDIEGICFTYTPETGNPGPDAVCVVVCDDNSPGLCDTTVIFFHFMTPVGPLACNTFIPWVQPTFPVTVDTDTEGLACWCGGSPSNVIDVNLGNGITGTIVVGGQLSLSVSDTENEYPAETFAGFVISSGLINLSVLDEITISTWFEGGFRESKTAADLIGLDIGLLEGPFTVGFVTTFPFDEIRITIDPGLGVGLFNVHYAVIERYCAPGFDLDDPEYCNSPVAMNKPVHPMTIDFTLTGTEGLSIGDVENPEGAILPGQHATLNLVANVAGSLSIAVEDQVTNHPAGTFVGFDIENSTLLGLGLLDRLEIHTYFDGDHLEERSGSGLLLGAPLLQASGRRTVGFVTTQPVDKVRLVFTGLVGVNVGVTRVHSAIFQAFCEGDPLACNTPTAISAPAYPVYIESARTGPYGGLCVDCEVTNAANVIDDNPATAASITLLAAVGSSGSLSVRKALSPWPANTFAGFRISNTNIVDVELLGGLTIIARRNGGIVDQRSGLTELAWVDSDLLLSESSELIAGFLVEEEYDEVQIRLVNLGDINLGATLVYELVVNGFCPAVVECDTSYYLTQAGEENTGFPVYVNFERTGGIGAVCVADITEVDNVITADTIDAAEINFNVGVLCAGSISVRDALFTYPPGTSAGFVIGQAGGLVELDLFQTITIETWLDGVRQEDGTLGDFLSLGLLILYIDVETGKYRVGFQTTEPFDEIRIIAANLAEADPFTTLLVYGAFVDTHASQEGEEGSGLLCFTGPLAVNDAATTVRDDEVKIKVLLNDEGGDGTLGEPTVVPELGPDFGEVSEYNPADSTFTYTPDPKFVGLDTFSYEVCTEGPVVMCDTAIVVITVLPRKDTIEVTIPEDSILVVCADTLTIFRNAATEAELCNMPAHGTAGFPDNENPLCMRYEPTPDYNGEDTVCVVVCEPVEPFFCDTTYIAITITPRNDLPAAVNDEVSGPEDESIDGEVFSNDTASPDGNNVWRLAEENGGAMHGAVELNPDGTFTYTPHTNFYGEDSFTYELCDEVVNEETGDCVEATVFITITQVCEVVDISVFLEGAYNTGTGLMNTTLNYYHILPGQDPDLSDDPGAMSAGVPTAFGQPYTSSPWLWPGNEGDGYGDITRDPDATPYPATVVDWVLVSVRTDPDDPGSTYWRCAGLLHSDGQIEFPEECDCFDVPPASTSTPYFIMVEHRNHLAVMSFATVSGPVYLVRDFTAGDSRINTNGSTSPQNVGQKQVNGAYVMHGGNGDQAGGRRIDINSSDNVVWRNQMSFNPYQYMRADHDLNGFIQLQDQDIWRQNNNLFNKIIY